MYIVYLGTIVYVIDQKKKEAFFFLYFSSFDFFSVFYVSCSSHLFFNEKKKVVVVYINRSTQCCRSSVKTIRPFLCLVGRHTSSSYKGSKYS